MTDKTAPPSTSTSDHGSEPRPALHAVPDAIHSAADGDANAQHHLVYVLGPFHRWHHARATALFLLLSCASSLFTDSSSVPPLGSLAFPTFFLLFSVGARTSGAAAGLVPLALCRSVGAMDYFRDEGVSGGVAYGIAFAIILLVWSLVLGAALAQKAAWLAIGASSNNSGGRRPCPPSSLSSSSQVFPVLLTAVFQILFRFSPIGAAGNPAMGLAYVPSVRQWTSLLGEIFLVFWVGWFAAVVAGLFVGRTSSRNLSSFVATSLVLYVYGWVRESLGEGMFLQPIGDWPLAKAGASPLRVACLTRANDTGTMIARTNARLAAGDDLIVWSEFSSRERVSPDRFDWTGGTVSNNNPGAVVAMAFGEEEEKEDEHDDGKAKWYNSVELMQAEQSLGRYDKNRPVPVIEAEIRAGNKRPTPIEATFTPIRSTGTDGTGNDERTNQTLRVATAICFDFDFPYLLRNAADADLAVGPSWYWSSIGRNMWGDNMFRAIEDGFTLIKCAEKGISGAVDPYGRVITALPTMKDSVTLMEVPVQAGVRTVYAHGGGFLFGWLCVALSPVLLMCIMRRSSSSTYDDNDGSENGSGEYAIIPEVSAEPPNNPGGSASDDELIHSDNTRVSLL